MLRPWTRDWRNYVVGNINGLRLPRWGYGKLEGFWPKKAGESSGLAASPPGQKHNGVKSDFRVLLCISGNQAVLHNQAASAIEVQEGRSARAMILWIIVSVGRAAAP